MLGVLDLKDIVAVSSDEKEIFSAHSGIRCFLSCLRSLGKRELTMIGVAHELDPEDDCLFLAEDIL